MIFDIFLTLILVLLNGFFVAAEFAIVKVRASQLELKAKAGSKLAPMAQNIVQNLVAYLGATQLGITLASLGLGWIGESVVAETLMAIFQKLHLNLSIQLAHEISLPIAFVGITIMHIVFGELVPKSLAVQRPETIAISLAAPLKLFYTLFRPFILFLNSFSRGVLKILGLPAIHGQGFHTAEELLILIEEGTENGAIDTSEHEMIRNVFSFNERTVKQIMVPRTQMVGIEMPLTNSEVVETVIREKYSRMPVYRDSIDNITGIIYAKDLLNIIEQKDAFHLKDIIRPAYFIPETKKISDLLHEFQLQRMHLAIVLDEFGGTAGMVTLEDIIEELVGEIQDEYDEEVSIVDQQGDDQFIVNAHSAITDVNDLLPVPLPEADDYDTVAGYLNVIFKKIPSINESRKSGRYEFTIMRKSRRSVKSVKLLLLPEQEKLTPEVGGGQH